jgi:hypothetical protein
MNENPSLQKRRPLSLAARQAAQLPGPDAESNGWIASAHKKREEELSLSLPFLFSRPL